MIYPRRPLVDRLTVDRLTVDRAYPGWKLPYLGDVACVVVGFSHVRIWVVCECGRFDGMRLSEANNGFVEDMT